MTEHIFREVHYGYTDGTALGRTLEKQEEIVRCRDCVYYKQDPEPTDPDWPMVGGCVVVGVAEPNGYCAWGERRTNDQMETQD